MSGAKRIMNVITIDPGLSGGIAILSSGNVTAHVMPANKIKNKRFLDLPSIKDLIGVASPSLVILEKQQSMPRQGVASTFKTGLNYGKLIGLLEGLGLDYIEVGPREWKKILPKEKRAEKKHTIDLVSSLYPLVNLVPPRCRKKHDGMADALGILFWYQTVYVD